ncbi:DUF3558 domain-containing protein [Actinophytocola sp.]|uniref:DUF3558 domain-containing protein n=1 Tax=Actinophytocola sp. TaxID=1872138 RepID=UPI00389AF616
MTPTRWLPLIAALSAALVVAGCTQTSAGEPLPDNTASSSGEANTADPTTSTGPSSERPREINLNGKDPCVIPQADWPKFGIEGPGEPSEHPDFKSPDCYYSEAGDVVLVVTAGIGIWTEDRYNAEIRDTRPIDGFHTITVASNTDRQACWAVVDVADGQFLMTIATPDPNDPGKPERCQLAYLMAESAMKALVAS